MTLRRPFAVLALALLPAAGAAQVVPDPAGDMVLVPAGSFIFGTDDGDADEAPRRSVILRAFLIDLTEVSCGAYARFVTATGRRPPPDWPDGNAPAGREDLPVVNVSWEDAAAFARWAGKRLPTELEWERAARGTDGRRFPWGDAEDEFRHNSRESGEVRPVRSFPEGRSPEGCWNLFGNVWEWCADPYGAYPGSLETSIHFACRYRVFRGGGALYFYGIPLPRSAAARGRGIPSGRHDALGFRCARDAAVPGTSTASRVPLSIREDAGVERTGDIVTAGIPYPAGALRDISRLRVLDPGGREVPLQAAVTGTWRDGSVRWALVDFPATVGAGEEASYSAVIGEEVARTESAAAVVLAEAADGISVATGRARFLVPAVRPGLFEGLSGPGGPAVRGGLRLSARIDGLGSEAAALAPSRLEVEERGPLRATIRIEGPIAADDGTEILRYVARVTARAGSRDVEMALTVLNPTPRALLVRRLRLSGSLAARADRWLVGGDRGDVAGAFDGTGVPCVLEQPTDLAFSLRRPDGTEVRGTRATGSLELREPAGRGLAIAVADFWQNFPKRLEGGPDGFALDLWPEGEAFEADAGIAKTHRLSFRPRDDGGAPAAADLAARLRRPLVAAAPPAHVCGSRALGPLAPHDFDGFPVYEALTERSADLYLRERPHGMRHFGDFYYGGPYKGKNAYGDLEYDLPLNYAVQFARTGLRKYLDAALDQARHQADIDVDHRTGRQYKHSPGHTETEADLGHVFLRGLVAAFHLTGERRLLEVAREIGDWLGPKVARPRSQGNERQIGWSLYALTGIYEATWDPRYIEWAKANVDSLVAGIGPTGKLDIRWDNRIAFFQGIAASGFLRYHEATGDDRVADATLRLCERLLGYYPEYLGRTLEALAWAHERSGDPRFLEMLARTWETTMLRAVNEGLDLGAGTIFTVHCLPFIRQAKLEEPIAKPLGLGPRELSTGGLHRLHLGAPAMTLLLETPDAEPFDLVVVRSGCTADASVTISAPGGDGVASALFGGSAALSQRRVIPVVAPPAARGRYLEIRLTTSPLPPRRSGPPNSMLTAIETSWDVITSRPLRRVARSEDGTGLETLTPSLCFRPRSDAARLEIRLTSRGEGFHGAVLRDPRGNPVAVSADFIDLDDASTHEYSLGAAVPPEDREGLWSLDLQAAAFRIEGARPWFSTSPESWFTP